MSHMGLVSRTRLNWRVMGSGFVTKGKLYACPNLSVERG